MPAPAIASGLELSPSPAELASGAPRAPVTPPISPEPEPAPPPGIRPGPPRVGRLVDEGDINSVGSREECVECLESRCRNEVLAGGDIEAARCLIPCVRGTSEAACMAEVRITDPVHGLRMSVCTGLSRSAETMALVQCGLSCACPDGLGDGDPEPSEVEAHAAVVE